MPTSTAPSSSPPDCVRTLPAAIDLLTRRERVILDMATAPGFNAAKMREALRKSGEIPLIPAPSPPCGRGPG